MLYSIDIVEYIGSTRSKISLICYVYSSAGNLGHAISFLIQPNCYLTRVKDFGMNIVSQLDFVNAPKVDRNYSGH